MKSFCSDLGNEEAVNGPAKSSRFFARGSTNGVKSSHPLDRIQRVQLLWTDTCKEVKHHYSKLSSALMLLTGRSLTPISSSSVSSPTTPSHASKSTSPEEQSSSGEFASQHLSVTGMSEPVSELDDKSLDSLLSSLQQEVNQQVKSLEQYLENDDNLPSSKVTPSCNASKSVPTISFSTDRSPGQRSKSMSKKRATSHKQLGNSLSLSSKTSQQNTDTADGAIQELDAFISSLTPPSRQGTSNYRSRSSTSDKAGCRLARKLREISPKLRGAEISLGGDAACPLQVAAIERRLTDYKVSQF